MDLLELFKIVNNESDSYFIAKKDYLFNIKNLNRFLEISGLKEVSFLNKDGYIGIFNTNKKEEINKIIDITIGKIKKDSV